MPGMCRVVCFRITCLAWSNRESSQLYPVIAPASLFAMYAHVDTVREVMKASLKVLCTARVCLHAVVCILIYSAVLFERLRTECLCLLNFCPLQGWNACISVYTFSSNYQHTLE